VAFCGRVGAVDFVEVEGVGADFVDVGTLADLEGGTGGRFGGLEGLG
jgi:hypothetical protein